MASGFVWGLLWNFLAIVGLKVDFNLLTTYSFRLWSKSTISLLCSANYFVLLVLRSRISLNSDTFSFSLFSLLYLKYTKVTLSLAGLGSILSFPSVECLVQAASTPTPNLLTCAHTPIQTYIHIVPLSPYLSLASIFYISQRKCFFLWYCFVHWLYWTLEKTNIVAWWVHLTMCSPVH